MSLDKCLRSCLRLWGRRPVIFAVTIGVLSLGTAPPTFGQLPINREGLTATVGRGVIVEAVSKNSQAEKAGIRTGDVLLNWSRGDADGAIDSPFDLPHIRFEQAPRGLVTVEGLRGNQQRRWRLGSDAWGIASRPNFSEPLLSMYSEGQALLAAGKPIEAADRWQMAATAALKCGTSWLGPWFLSRAGQVLFDADQWDAVDEAYRKATQAVPDPGPIVQAELFRQWAAGFNYRDDLVNAEKYYGQVLLEWQKLGSKTMAVSNALLQLANVELELGELDKAEKYLRQAFLLAQALAPSSYQATLILADLGVLFEERGELSKAEEYYLKGLAHEQRFFPGSLHLAHTLAALGTLAHQRGDFGTAEAYYRRALAIATKLDRESLDVAQILSDLSECILARHDSQRAEAYEEHALSIR